MAKKAVTSEILNIVPIDLSYLNDRGITEDCLAGKTAVVTGGASNVGLGYARALAWCGANVVVADLNEKAGIETQRVINEENGRDCCLFVTTNVTKQEDIDNLAAQAFAKFGKVDILLNNAMNMRLNGPLLSSPVEDLVSSFEISGKGVMMACKAFVPGMIERGYGVVTYSATQFHYCPPMVGGTVYTAGKPHHLVLDVWTQQPSSLKADGEDLAFVTVSLVDKRGTLIPDASDQLRFKVSGAGTYRAACNGDATSLEPFTEPAMRLFNGQTVVVVQSSKQPGNLTLTVQDTERGMKQQVVIPVK